MQRQRHLEQEKKEASQSMASLKKDWEKERKGRSELQTKTAELIR